MKDPLGPDYSRSQGPISRGPPFPLELATIGFEQLAARFDTQAARLDRQDRAEKIDPALEAAELNKRVADLGTRLPRSNSL